MWGRIVLVGLAAAWFGCSAHATCAAPPTLAAKLRANPDAKTFTNLGLWFDQRHEYACAAQAYRSALKLDPVLPHTLELLGASLYSSGDLNGAIRALQESIRLAPNNISPRLRLAAALEEAGRKDEAKAEWQAALTLDPQSKAALHGFCRHMIAEGNYGAVLTRISSVQRDEALTLDLAEAYWKSGMLKDADELLTSALSHSPASFPVTNALSTVQFDEGLREKALRTAEQYARSHPDNREAQKLKLRMLLANNDTATAYPLGRKLLAAFPRDAYLLYTIGVMERQNGDYEAARHHLEQAIALEPDVYNSHYQLGLVLAKLDDMQGAREHFEKALALGAKEPEVHLELATAFRKLGNSADAEKQLQLYGEASQAQANHSVAEGKAMLAEKELNSGDPLRAAALYREALESTPNDALLNYKLSIALDKAGDITGERSALEKAVELDPDMAIAHNQLGYLASRAGDIVSAEEHFRQAVRAAPAFTDAWINLAATLGTESKFREAREAVEMALKLDPRNEAASHLRDDLAAGQGQH